MGQHQLVSLLGPDGVGWGQGCPTNREEERVSKSQDLEMDKSSRARAKREERV